MRRSAGILLYRLVAVGSEAGFEVLLGHMGGPFWARKDAGAWTIPKGEYGADEDPLAAACREFVEETGVALRTTAFTDLGEVRQSGGKVVRAWAIEGDLDPAAAVSNTFEMEWPPASGRMATLSGTGPFRVVRSRDGTVQDRRRSARVPRPAAFTRGVSDRASSGRRSTAWRWRRVRSGLAGRVEEASECDA